MACRTSYEHCPDKAFLVAIEALTIMLLAFPLTGIHSKDLGLVALYQLNSSGGSDGGLPLIMWQVAIAIRLARYDGDYQKIWYQPHSYWQITLSSSYRPTSEIQ